jgi:hypothetical protein
MFIRAACVVATVVPFVIGVPVVAVVIGTAVVIVVIDAVVVSVVTGAVVTSVVTVGTGVGVTVVGLCVVHPAHSTLTVIKTAKIRIFFLSMTEFSAFLMLQVCLNLAMRIIKNFLSLFHIPCLTLISRSAG